MAYKEISLHCRHCNNLIQETVHYTPDEEILLKSRENDGRFFMKIWSGLFIFGITVLLFVWALVLMLKTFEMKKLDKMLADPNVQYEETWRSDTDPQKAAEMSRTIRVPKGGAVAIESLQKELDQAKLIQNSNLLIKAHQDLERAADDKKREIEKTIGPEEKK